MKSEEPKEAEGKRQEATFPELLHSPGTASSLPKRRIFISTGEVSGDLQGALLIRALRDRATEMGLDLEITALGGDRMAAAGAQLLSNTSTIGSIGLFESLPYV